MSCIELVFTIIGIFIAVLELIIVICEFKKSRDKSKEDRIISESEDDIISMSHALGELYDYSQCNGNIFAMDLVERISMLSKSYENLIINIKPIYNKLLEDEKHFSLSYGFRKYIDAFGELINTKDSYDEFISYEYKRFLDYYIEEENIIGVDFTYYNSAIYGIQTYSLPGDTVEDSLKRYRKIAEENKIKNKFDEEFKKHFEIYSDIYRSFCSIRERYTYFKEKYDTAVYLMDELYTRISDDKENKKNKKNKKLNLNSIIFNSNEIKLIALYRCLWLEKIDNKVNWFHVVRGEFYKTDIYMEIDEFILKYYRLVECIKLYKEMYDEKNGPQLLNLKMPLFDEFGKKNLCNSLKNAEKIKKEKEIDIFVNAFIYNCSFLRDSKYKSDIVNDNNYNNSFSELKNKYKNREINRFLEEYYKLLSEYNKVINVIKKLGSNYDNDIKKLKENKSIIKNNKNISIEDIENIENIENNIIEYQREYEEILNKKTETETKIEEYQSEYEKILNADDKENRSNDDFDVTRER